MRKLLLALAVCVCALPLAAATPEQWKADYDLLQKWQYSAAIPLAKPVTITRDTATFTLTTGSVALAAPTSTGRVTGLVFEGNGRFSMTVPDKYELAQLRRFADKPLLTKVDEPMNQLVLRVSDDTIDKLFPGAAKPPFSTNAIAEKRENHWLIDLGRDVDARIVTAMANPGALQWTAGIKTDGYDWLTYDYDSGRGEEIELIRYIAKFPEVWLSLDRAEDRAADGRPGPRDGRPAKLSFIDVKATSRSSAAPSAPGRPSSASSAVTTPSRKRSPPRRTASWPCRWSSPRRRRTSSPPTSRESRWSSCATTSAGGRCSSTGRFTTTSSPSSSRRR